MAPISSAGELISAVANAAAGISAMLSIVAEAMEACAETAIPDSSSAVACSADAGSSPATVATASGTRLSWKQDRQKTGRPCVGLNGTVVSTPHAEHSVRVSVRDSGKAATAAAPSVDRPKPARFALQSLQRFGSFLNWRSKKNSCSPAVKTKSLPQSEHRKMRSTKSIAPSPRVRE